MKNLNCYFLDIRTSTGEKLYSSTYTNKAEAQKRINDEFKINEDIIIHAYHNDTGTTLTKEEHTLNF